MNFYEAEISLQVQVNKLESDLRRAERASQQSATKLQRDADKLAKAMDRENAKFTKEIERANKQAAKEAEKAAKAAARAWEKRMKQIKKATKAAFLDVGRFAKQAAESMVRWMKWAVAGITAAFVLSVRAAAKQEDVLERLNIVLRSTGHAAGLSAQELAEHAKELQKTTIIGDEATMSMQAFLLTFKGIKGDQFKRATEAVLDTAVALAKARGTAVDMTTTATMLGKVLNDPVANMGALSRAGIQFSISQKDMIKTLVESGDLMGAQNIILKELESQFGGMASNISTLSGKWAQFKNVIGDTLESLGGPFLAIVGDFFTGMARWLTENQEKLKAWATTAANRVQDIVGYFTDLLRFLNTDWTKGTNLILDLFIINLRSFGDTAIAVLLDVGHRAASAFVQAFGARLGKYLMEIGRPEGPLGKLSAGIPAIGAARLGIIETGYGLVESSKRKPYKSDLANQLTVIKARREAEMMAAEQTYGFTRTAQEKLGTRESKVEGTSAVLSNVESARKQIEDANQQILKANKLITAEKEKQHQAFVTQLEFLHDIEASEAKRMEQEKALVEAQKQHAKEAGDILLRMYDDLGDSSQTYVDLQLSAIEATAESFETTLELAGMLNEETQALIDKWKEYQEQQVKVKEGMSSFWNELSSWGAKAKDIWGNLGQAVTSTLDSVTNAISDALMGMEADWKAIGKSFVKMILNMIIQLQMLYAFQLMTGTAGGGTGNFLGRLFNAPGAVPTADEGGYVEKTGLAVIHKGETYSGVNNQFAKPVTVNVINNAAVSVATDDSRMTRENVLSIIINAAETDGTYRNSIKNIRS